MVSAAEESRRLRHLLLACTEDTYITLLYIYMYIDYITLHYIILHYNTICTYVHT